MASCLQEMYRQLGFITVTQKKIVVDQGLNYPYCLCECTNKNAYDNCYVVKKSEGKTINGIPTEGEQVSVMAQEYETSHISFHLSGVVLSSGMSSMYLK